MLSVSLNGYLSELSAQAIIRNSEKDSIRRSLLALQQRVDEYFGDEVEEHFVFGSYSRGTILPRGMDDRSDVDYMIVFADSNYRPQTYLDRLRRFVDAYYSRSIVAQAHPTIALSLNHIRFELVPAIDNWWKGIRIPAKASAYTDWLDTNPTDFNADLIAVNKANGNMIKPLIRLVKYWNSSNGYIYESYELEKMVISRGYWLVGGLLSTGQLKDYVFSFMNGLSYSWGTAQWRKDKIDRAHRLLDRASRLNNSGDEISAVQSLSKLLPPFIK